MFNRLLVLALVALFTLNLQAQKIQNLELPSDGKIILSEKTDTAKTYIITVEGTYSMWPREGSTVCYGVDAAYVYDVPKAEVDALRWLPEYIEIAGQKIPILPLPQYVGDDRELKIPPEQLGAPLYKLSFRRYVGFRVDGEPLPNLGFNNLNHVYTIEKKGTGLPFNFQILDTNYSVLAERTLPRYDDNCGFLKIKIEEKEGPKIEFCELGTICEDSLIVGIRVSSRIFVEDSSSITGKKNLLKYIDKSQIGIVENGKFKCDIDSIFCDTKEGFAVGIVVDQSGSMEGRISEEDGTQRMQASKTALNLFSKNLSDKDSLFVIGFENKVNLLMDWTNSKDDFNNVVDTLKYVTDARTSLFDGVIQALDKVSKSSSKNRYLLLISDGGNTIPEKFYPEVPDSIRKIIAKKSVNIPIYILALGFTKNPVDNQYIDPAGRGHIRDISQISRGRDLDIYNSKDLDSLLKNFKLDVNSEDCCEIRFNIDKCKKGESRVIRIIYSPDDSTMLTKTIKFDCDCFVTSIRIEDDEEFEDTGFDIYPNPTNSISNIQYKLPKSGSVVIRALDLLGNIVYQDNLYQNTPGIYNYNFESSGLNSGTYYIQIISSDITLSEKLIIIK